MSRALSRSSEPQNSRSAMLLLAGFAIAWVLLEAVVGARLVGHYNLMQVVWCRYAVHLLILGLLFGWRRPERLWRTGRPAYQLARSLMMLAMPLSFALAVGVGTPAATVWSAFWLSPLLLIALAQALLGERVSWRIWAAATIGGLATALMLAPTRPQSLWLLLLPGVMALSFSLYVVMTRSLRSESVHANLLYTALGVFVALTPFMPKVWVTPSLYDASVLIGIGGVGLVALLALDRSVSLAPVSVVAPILFLQVVVLAAVDLLQHGNPPTRRSLGGAIVIVAIAGFTWSHESSRSTARAGLREVPSENPV